MYHDFDEIDIPEEGLEMTKQQCSNVLKETIPPTKLSTIFQLYMLDTAYYIKSACLGIVILLTIGFFFPDIYLACSTLYFMILGALSAYETHKHHIYEMNELLDVTYLNSGRTFLYKSILISTLQIIGFIFILLIQLNLPNANISLLILNTILPIYLIQCISMVFERFIHTKFSAIILYASCYGIYTTVKEVIIFQLMSIPMLYVYTGFGMITVLLIILLFISYKNTEKEETFYGISNEGY